VLELSNSVPVWQEGYQSHEMITSRVSSLDKFFDARTREERLKSIETLVLDEATVQDAVKYAVFDHYAEHPEHAQLLLARAGWATVAFATKFLNADYFIDVAYRSAIWDLVLSSLVTADDVPFAFRQAFLSSFAYRDSVVARKAASHALLDLLED